jgi:hypothetical protein
LVPFDWGKLVLQAPFQAAVIHRLLVANYSLTEHWMAKNHAMWPPFSLNDVPLASAHFVKIEESGCAQQTVTLDGPPASSLSHVIEDWAIREEFLQFVLVH